MRPFARRKTVEFRPVAIAGDGALARHGVGEGRMIPLLILDTGERADIAEWIRIHQYSGPGDVLATWGQPTGRKDAVSLILQFQRPLEIEIAIVFELCENHSILVEGILRSRGLYIQAGAAGDRVRNTLDQPRVIVEVPDTGFAAQWERICLAHLVRKARDRGSDRRTAKRIAVEGYATLRKMAAARPFPS